MADTILVYPYEFEGGKKAVASQVNANFEAVKTFARSINISLAQLQESLTDLKNKPTREMLDVFYSFSKKTPAGAYPLWTGETITHCKSLYPQFWKEINNLADQNNLAVVTADEYEQRIAKYGQCAAFYIDTLNGHVRLPKITQFISSISQLSELSKEQEAGLPNIKGTIYRSASYTLNPEVSGVFNVVKTGAASTSSVGKTSHSTITFDASTYNTIYGKSTTVQPPSVRLGLYLQVANNIAELSELDTQSIAKELEDGLEALSEAYDNYSLKLQKQFENLCDQMDFASGISKETDITVTSEMFVEDSTYPEYPYAADLSIDKADVSSVPIVNFGMDQTDSGLYASIAYSGDGFIRIYAKEKPTESFVIPSVILQ